jgi:hypothetical protein
MPGFSAVFGAEGDFRNLLFELCMVLALPFALYSNEQKEGEPHLWHLMK